MSRPHGRAIENLVKRKYAQGLEFNFKEKSNIRGWFLRAGDGIDTHHWTVGVPTLDRMTRITSMVPNIVDTEILSKIQLNTEPRLRIERKTWETEYGDEYQRKHGMPFGFRYEKKQG